MWLLGCLCLIPFPSVLVGNTTRLQMVNAAFVLCLALRRKLINPRMVYVWLLMGAPAAIAAAVHLSGQTFPVETLKLSAIWLFSTAHLIAGTPRDELETVQLLKGLSVGVLVNCVVGLLQLLTVPSGTFPLWSWYGYGATEAEAMRSFQSGAGIFSVRVWGLFSEPSDMTASIGQWWLLLLGLRLGVARGSAAVLFRFRASRLCAAALFGGAVLMMLSRSGQVLIVAAGAATLIITAIFPHLKRRRKTRAPLVLALIVVPMLAIGIYDLYQRVEDLDVWAGGTPSSWQLRASSLSESLSLWKDSSAREFIFGLGYDGPATLEYNTGYNVWSVVVKSLLTFGATALVGWLALAFGILRNLRGAGSIVMAVVFGLACAAAIAFTTSSEGLISPWLALGLLFCWRTTFRRERRQRLMRIATEAYQDLAAAES